MIRIQKKALKACVNLFPTVVYWHHRAFKCIKPHIHFTISSSHWRNSWYCNCDYKYTKRQFLYYLMAVCKLLEVPGLKIKLIKIWLFSLPLHMFLVTTRQFVLQSQLYWFFAFICQIWKFLPQGYKTFSMLNSKLN